MSRWSDSLKELVASASKPSTSKAIMYQFPWSWMINDSSGFYPTDKPFPSDLRAPAKSTEYGGSLRFCTTAQTHLSRSRQRDLARKQN